MRDVQTIKDERQRLRNDMAKCEIKKRKLIDHVMSHYGSFRDADDQHKYMVSYLSESILALKSQIEALTFTLNEYSIIPDVLSNFKWNKYGINRESIFGEDE